MMNTTNQKPKPFAPCPCGCGQIHSATGTLLHEQDSTFHRYCKEIDAGPFSILSERAKDEIKTYIRLAMEDGYKRGFHAGHARGQSAQ
jgi:hypothetical protein